MTNSVTLNGNTYNDGDVPPRHMGNGGHRDNLFPLLSDAVVDLAAKQSSAAASASTATTQAGIATTQAGNAASSAAAAAASAAAAQGFISTSTTSLTIGTGPISLTVQTLELYQPGQFATIASVANPADFMYGQVTAYTSGTGALGVNVLRAEGVGTFASWDISLSGIRGPTGATGPAGTASPELFAFVAAQG